MRKLLLLFVFVVGLAPLVFAANPTKFYWTPPTTNVDGSPLTDLAGYKVYCGNASGNYTIIKDTGMLLPTPTEVEYLISNVIPGGQDKTWYCVVTAYDDAGNESGYSNEVSFPLDQVVPVAPGAFGVR